MEVAQVHVERVATPDADVYEQVALLAPIHLGLRAGHHLSAETRGQDILDFEGPWEQCFLKSVADSGVSQ